MKPPITVTITGAAGMIGYSLLFRAAAGSMLGKDTPVRLRLLEVPQAVRVAEGVAMELDDCAYPLLVSVDVTDDPMIAFEGANLALMVGAWPRRVGQERSDLLNANGHIFATQGQAINDVAADDVRVLVVGNPSNTNALIAAINAPDVPKDRFSALTRLDHNRAMWQLAQHAGVHVTEVRRMSIWGNHSVTQYPNVFHAQVAGRPGSELAADTRWLKEEFIPEVAERGARVLEVRGSSSQASAADASIQHVRDWYFGTKAGEWSSAAIWTDGEYYDIPGGLVCSFPVTSDGQRWSVVEGLEIDPLSRRYIDVSVAELVEEREAVRALGLI
ncbi:MAG: malate dehydrogenase [Promicromonosporaceae bacterium]|nr:malate dehydrogenase [Promicromonosporaceae bacterium]